MSMADLPKILVVDDVRANLVGMRRLLAPVKAEIYEAHSGNEALALCLDHRFALILLDVQMPDMDGFEVAALLNNDPATCDVPIVFVTAAYHDERRVWPGPLEPLRRAWWINRARGLWLLRRLEKRLR